MATRDFRRFHELAEEFKSEMSLVKICEMEGADYRSYISWRSRKVCAGTDVIRMEFTRDPALLEF